MSESMLTPFFRFDTLAAILSLTILAIGLCVLAFSRRYMHGEPRPVAYYTHLILLVLAAVGLACADHMAIFALFWGLSAVLLALLIGHYRTWPQAIAARRRTLLMLGTGTLCLITAFSLIAASTGITTLSGLNGNGSTITDTTGLFAGLLLIAAAMLQCACMPFHGWLTTSMPAPTPVSALMHAGLVNAGGLLIVRCHALFNAQAELLLVLFALAGLAALFAGLCMRVRCDIKGQLAFSTSAQMSFMLAQCGLGLYSAAIAHLILHGLFKAYHFLAAGNALSHARAPSQQGQSFTPGQGFAMLTGGGIAVTCLIGLGGKDIASIDTPIVLLIFGGIAGMQAMRAIWTIPTGSAFTRFMTGLILITLAAGHYALIYAGVNSALGINAPQPLSIAHIIITSAFILAWLAGNFARLDSFPGLYMRLFNAGRSQRTIS
jgi:NAD(P)H-quinone oxidoreductase subunit 5